jgi:hypothetical protein
MLFVGCLSAISARAQNLEAGKSPSQLFAGNCSGSGCHKSARGLLRTVSPGSLPGFLQEHYTTSGEMASVLSAFLISNGANNTRYVGGEPQQGKRDKDVKPVGLSEPFDRPGRRPDAAALPQDAVGPDGNEFQTPRQGRKRAGRSGEQPDAPQPALDGQAPALGVSERDPDGRKSSKQKLSKRVRPAGEEPSKTDGAKTDPSSVEPVTSGAKDEQPKNEAAKDEGSTTDPAKTEGAKPSSEAKSEAAKADAPKETISADPAPQPDPVSPPVPPAATSSPPAAQSAAAPAVTASAPQPASSVPAGPPVPPISQ